MDMSHDNATGTPLDAAGSIFSGVQNMAASIRNKAKAKKAQGIANAGNYWTLTPFQKSLIPVPQYIIDQVGGLGITATAVSTLPAQGVGSDNAGIISKLKILSGGGTLGSMPIGGGVIEGDKTAAEAKATADEGAKTFIQKYGLYLAGAAVLLLVIYFATKHK